MCPACLLSATLVAGGATTAGSAAALFVKCLLARKRRPGPEALQHRAVRRDDEEPESYGG